MLTNLTNREVFAKDPLAATIPNDGVAKVTEPQTQKEWEVLRYELSTFVCDGEYKRGLQRILDTYLRNLDEATQPAVWVSGFYGSGKSHFVRVFEFLWRDQELPDGATARGLVTLPDEIKAQLRELTVRSRREGGLWSAGGTLSAGAGDSVRLALLSILFRGAGLPANYSAAQFVLWLKQNGYYEAVKIGVEAAGKKFDAEVRRMHLSPVLAQSLLAVYPSFADGEMATYARLDTQFPPKVDDISDEEMIDTMREVLALQSKVAGKLPCTLIVLDELQQFIGDNPDRTSRVQNVVEACSARFGSLLLFVATGQAALQDTIQLQKLQGRFTVQVTLSDNDVERVVREVVLRKAPNKEDDLRQVLDECSGEIDRHLQGSKIAPEEADRAVLTADYPLLPSRRRFWERVLRAVDRAGAAGQLRTQLRVVHEAVREVAEKPLGTVVAADRLYYQQSQSMLQSGALHREVDQIIRGQDDNTAEGKLRSRVCATIFLVGQLTSALGEDLGVRATAATLADLLVEDLRSGGTTLRKQIPELLKDMVDKGSLLLLGDEYRLQTKESAEWENDYRGRYAKIFGDDARIAGDRATELKNACGQALTGLNLPQGVSKTTRKVDLHFGGEPPKTNLGTIPIWIRDEWSVSGGEKTVREDAQAAGSDSSIIYVFLPRRAADALKEALAGHAAATETLTRPQNATPAGIEAKAAMQSRLDEQRSNLNGHMDNVLKDAKVFQGGGNEVVQGDLRASVQTAMQASLLRLYPQFEAGDEPKWGKVVERIRQGNNNAFAEILGFTGDVDKHPVCQQVLNCVGPGKKGAEVRKHFEASPFGWPRDTVDGALLTLVASGHLRAAQNAAAVVARQIDQTKLAQTEFRREGFTITTPQRIAVRKLLTDAGIATKPDEEARALVDYLNAMQALAQTAGGEKPLPALPDTKHLDDLKAMAGNELILAVYEQRDRLAKERKDWQAATQLAATRQPRWQSLQRLLQEAESLPIHSEIAPQVEAIAANRKMLAEPDPVAPLCARLTDELRQALQAARQQYAQVYANGITGLQGNELWNRLDAADQQQILNLKGLSAAPEFKVGTEAEVLAALRDTPLSVWEHKTAAIPQRVAAALLEAAQRLEPQAVQVHLPAASLKTAEEVDTYLAGVRAQLLQHINDGNPVII